MADFEPDPEHDYREDPGAYRYTADERGVFKVQPYKDELLPHWSYRDPAAAEHSIEALTKKFEEYVSDEDFVGADMVRKYLRMGFTRAMRYAKYPGGNKYDEDGEEREAQRWADEEKRAVATRYKSAWDEVREDERYQSLKSGFIDAQHT